MSLNNTIQKQQQTNRNMMVQTFCISEYECLVFIHLIKFSISIYVQWATCTQLSYQFASSRHYVKIRFERRTYINEHHMLSQYKQVYIRAAGLLQGSKSSKILNGKQHIVYILSSVIKFSSYSGFKLPFSGHIYTVYILLYCPPAGSLCLQEPPDFLNIMLM